MSERDSSEFETSEFCLKTETRVSVQKHKKWILTGLSFLNKSRGWISTNLVPVPTQIQISGSGQWVDCRMWQLQKISHPKLELWIATSNFNFKTSQKLRMLSRSLSDCKSLLLNLNLNLNRCLCLCLRIGCSGCSGC